MRTLVFNTALSDNVVSNDVPGRSPHPLPQSDPFSLATQTFSPSLNRHVINTITEQVLRGEPIDAIVKATRLDPTEATEAIKFFTAITCALVEQYSAALTPVGRTYDGATLDGIMPEETSATVAPNRALQRLEDAAVKAQYSASETARELGVSLRTLQRAISTDFGMTASKLLEQMRMRHATRLVEESDIPIKAVAIEVGFNQLSNFSRAFKQHTGLSPREYRELHRSSSAYQSHTLRRLDRVASIA